MAYDRFEGTPFDLDHDGKIDAKEAAYIYQTFYEEKDDSSNILINSKSSKTFDSNLEGSEKMADAIRGSKQHETEIVSTNCIIWIIMFIVAIMFKKHVFMGMGILLVIWLLKNLING